MVSAHEKPSGSNQMTLDAAPGYLSAEDCRLADLVDLVSQKTDLADYPHASTVDQNVLIYDGARLRTELSRPACRPRVEAELARALLDGPGIVLDQPPTGWRRPPKRTSSPGR